MSPGTRSAGWRAALAVMAVVLVADQASKAAVSGAIERGERVEVLPFLDLVHVMNQGVAFGFLGDGSRGVVLAVTLAALAAVLVWFALEPRRPGAWLAIGLLAGGAVGNLVDRIREDAVTDFIDLPAWPSFNLADVAITFGAVLLVIGALFGAGEREGGSDAHSGRA